MVGPSLAGIVGRKAGTEAGYNYSEAMKNSLPLDPRATLQLSSRSEKIVPGNEMPYAGMKSADDPEKSHCLSAGTPKPS